MSDRKVLLELKNVYYSYGTGTVYEVHALQDVSVRIGSGEFIGVIGHTGSGKSTLIQHMNALVKPSAGQVLFKGEDVWANGYDRRALRTQVGLVFQYPENQLFETTVLLDVMFGPKNKGLTEDEARKRAVRALTEAGVSEDFFEASPFELSGGQKRRVAIAGVLAMDPEILILDEPTAGLDPAGRDEILGAVRALQKDRGITVILVSHSMEDVAVYADRLLLVHDGRIVRDDAPREVFADVPTLESMGLSAPQVSGLMRALAERGLEVDTRAVTVEEAKESILRALWRTED